MRADFQAPNAAPNMAARNNLLRMLLLNMPQQQQQQYMSRLNPMNSQYMSEQSKSENGLQYKIVHLKFKIEPQQGSL
jgi:hypothetical protein